MTNRPRPHRGSLLFVTPSPVWQTPAQRAANHFCPIFLAAAPTADLCGFVEAVALAATGFCYRRHRDARKAWTRPKCRHVTPARKENGIGAAGRGILGKLWGNNLCAVLSKPEAKVDICLHGA
jgi:hypothetical protein